MKNAVSIYGDKEYIEHVSIDYVVFRFPDGTRDKLKTRKSELQAVKYHYGGYISWKDNGDTKKIKGCYGMENENISTGSDHLRD